MQEQNKINKAKAKKTGNLSPFAIGGTSPYALHKPVEKKPVAKKKGEKIVIYVK
jgi:hypothetical protein